MVQISRISPHEAQIRECYGRVVYSHKAHEKCADILLQQNKCLKTIQIIVSALTACGVLAIIFTDTRIYDVVTSIVALFSFGVSLYLKEYDLGALAQQHSDTATELWDIREMYLSLLTDMNGGEISQETIIAKRDALQDRLKTVYKRAPRTTSRAYLKAQKSLRKNEEMYFSNEELNDLLPVVLRKP